MNTFTILLVVSVLISSINLTESLPNIRKELVGFIKGGDDPDIYLSTPQIIARHGYSSQAYTVKSSDGFLLTLFRIPFGKTNNNNGTREPVFLQHGLLGSSADWVLQGNASLAFLLSDAGYDVWLGNARGNMYSRGHSKYTPKDSRFWDFSWHEMGVLDLPIVLAFIGNKTNQTGNITYIGHSMGTTMFFVYASTHQNAKHTVKKMIALAPVAFTAAVRSPIRYLAPWANDIEWMTKYFGLNEFLPNNKIIKYLADVGCDSGTAEMKLCEDVIFLFCGFDKEEFNTKILLSVLNHEPAGTSTKTVIHYAQEIKSGGKFIQFDYGTEENLKRYGMKHPPIYNLTNIEVPVYLMSSVNDWLAGPQDVHKLSTILPNKIGDYIVPMKAFNHIDFLFGKDAAKLVYRPLMKVIQNQVV